MGQSCSDQRLRRARHRVARCDAAAVVEYDLGVRWFPAIEQALQISVDADLQVMIDTGLAATAAAPEPSQALGMDVDGPIEPHLRWADVPAIVADQRVRIERRRAGIPAVTHASHER